MTVNELISELQKIVHENPAAGDFKVICGEFSERIDHLEVGHIEFGKYEFGEFSFGEHVAENTVDSITFF